METIRLYGSLREPYINTVKALSDAFDALTSKRPYRDAMPMEKALRTLYDGIDVEFDSYDPR